MQSTMKCFAAVAVMAFAGQSFGGVVAFDRLGNDGSDNLTSFSQNPAAGAFSSAGDIFETVEAGVDEMPFALADDSTTDVSGAGAGSPFAPDDDGIVDTADFTANNDVFGAVDTDNSDFDGTATATWEFDISGATAGLASVVIEFAAQGDFEESSDFFDVTYSIDGATAQPLFTSSVDEDGSQEYQVDSGATDSLDDPMLINGTLLDNEFQAITAAISGTGSTLTLTLSAELNGGSEAVALDNISVNEIPEPASLTLLGLGGLALLRRRNR